VTRHGTFVQRPERRSKCTAGCKVYTLSWVTVWRWTLGRFSVQIPTADQQSERISRCLRKCLHKYCEMWPEQLSRHSDGLRAGQPGIYSQLRRDILLFSTAFRPSLGPTQPPVQWVSGALSSRIKEPGREADHSPSSAQVDNAASYTPIPPYVFRAWCLIN
jgi:hypothetical protein